MQGKSRPCQRGFLHVCANMRRRLPHRHLSETQPMGDPLPSQGTSIMTIDEFRDCLLDYYQTEVRGEAFFAATLSKFDAPDHAYKLGSLLQLETETKARLRPTILELGGSVEELESSRSAGLSRAASISAGDWEGFVRVLNKVGESLTNRQREVSEIAPQPYRELALSMKIHGESIQDFTDRELAGDSAHSIDSVVLQLKFPLRRS